jgi:hypothetical protein
MNRPLQGWPGHNGWCTIKTSEPRGSTAIPDMTALNLTSPNGNIGFRFVKNADGMNYNHYEQFLDTDQQTLRKCAMSIQEVTQLAASLRAHGWR